VLFATGRICGKNRFYTCAPPVIQRGRHRSNTCRNLFAVRHPQNWLPPQATVTPFSFHQSNGGGGFSVVRTKRFPPRRSASFGGTTSRSHTKYMHNDRLAPPNKCSPIRRNRIQPLSGSNGIFRVGLRWVEKYENACCKELLPHDISSELKYQNCYDKILCIRL